MKTSAFFLFLLATGLLTAQDKPKDPFVKNKPEAKEKAVPETLPKNILCLVETITLSQADYLALVDSEANRAKLYESAQAAVKAGTASLDGCHFLTSKDGTRSSLEGVDELVYPTEWDVPDSTGFQYPAAWETRPLGDCWEFEPVLPEKEGPLSITHLFTRDRLEAFRRIKADATLAGVPWCELSEQHAPASCDVLPGVPTLIATLTQQPGKPDSITLVFATLRVAPLTPPAQPAPKGSTNAHLTARVISLDRMKGADLLKRHWQKDAACLAELNTMIAAKEAALEHVSTVITRSGSRAVHQSGLLSTYGIEYNSPDEGVPGQLGANGQMQPASSSRKAGIKSTETRLLGYNWEVEPLVNEERTFGEVTLALTRTRMEGPLKDKEWSEHYPETPVFSSQKITTSITLPVDSTTLFGTLTPPGDTGVNGRKDEGRIWLVFFDMRLE